MADEIARARALAVAPGRDGARECLCGVGVEGCGERRGGGDGVDLDVLIAPPPLPDKLERHVALARVDIGERVGTMRRGRDADARSVGDDEPGGAGIALAIDRPDDPRAALDRGRRCDRRGGCVTGRSLGRGAEIAGGAVDRLDPDGNAGHRRDLRLERTVAIALGIAAADHHDERTRARIDAEPRRMRQRRADLRLMRGDDREHPRAVHRGPGAKHDRNVDATGDDRLVRDWVRAGQQDDDPIARAMFDHDPRPAIAIGLAQAIGLGDAVGLGAQPVHRLVERDAERARIFAGILHQRIDRHLDARERGRRHLCEGRWLERGQQGEGQDQPGSKRRHLMGIAQEKRGRAW